MRVCCKKRWRELGIKLDEDMAEVITEEMNETISKKYVWKYILT